MISTLRVSKIYRKYKGKSKNLKSEENPKKKKVPLKRTEPLQGNIFMIN